MIDMAGGGEIDALTDAEIRAWLAALVERLSRELPDMDLAFLCATAAVSHSVAADLAAGGATVCSSRNLFPAIGLPAARRSAADPGGREGRSEIRRSGCLRLPANACRE